MYVCLKIRGRILLAIAKCKSVAPVCMAARPHYVIRQFFFLLLPSIVYLDNPFNQRFKSIYKIAKTFHFECQKTPKDHRSKIDSKRGLFFSSQRRNVIRDYSEYILKPETSAAVSIRESLTHPFMNVEPSLTRPSVPFSRLRRILRTS